tara:strand:+ start:3432 stop:4268 length:837 start_codon:yes stop_codon:yes gene_type:complete
MWKKINLLKTMKSLLLKEKINTSQSLSVIDIFEKAARKAGQSLINDFGKIENSHVRSKDVGDFVTTSDIKTEKILLKILQNSYPNATYITEESDEIRGDKEIIVIDPIDGTTNFIHGIPFVGIVIGRVFEGEITDGIIFNPILNELYWATKGGGAWCNNKRLHVSNRDKMSNCIIGTSVPHANRGYKNYLDEIDNIAKNCAGLRSTGSAAIDLSLVASGKIDAFWQRNLKLWDICSGILIVNEAGGKVTQPNGKDWTVDSSDILASNLFVHQQIVEKL